jgi:glycosyltransferase involved in cell wall biosynthesis
MRSVQVVNIFIRKQVINVKLVFTSNYFNHHQKPFCDELYQRLGDDFAFIANGVMGEERKKLGYSQGDVPSYVHFAFLSQTEREKAKTLINEADVVIAGATPNDMLLERIRSGKLLFRYSERPYKIKPTFPKKVYHAYRFRKNNLWRRNIYMLCASAYTAQDFASLGMYRGRTYKWGYFPEVKAYDTVSLMAKKKRNTLMWCGRFIDWKHPDDAIYVAQKLKDAGYDFHLNMVGTGTMDEYLRILAEAMDVADRVSFTGSMPPEQVRVYMEEAGIYLFTSDRQEGWGAVLNESMNSGCAVVASHALGSAPFLIRDGQSGLIYESGNRDMLFEKVKYLLDHPEEQERMGLEAYGAMQGTWNGKVAADRILRLSERILAGEKRPKLFEDGPGSAAR